MKKYQNNEIKRGRNIFISGIVLGSICMVLGLLPSVEVPFDIMCFTSLVGGGFLLVL